MSAKAEAKKKAKTRPKTIVKKPKVVAPDARLRKKPKYKSFQLHETIKHSGPSLPSWLAIGKKAVRLLLANARPMTWFLVVYGLLFLVFVRGIVAPLDIDSIRAQIETYTGSSASLSDNVTIMGLLINSSLGASGDVSAMYQMIFVTTSALALIWLFRQQQAGNKVSLKEAYYRGMYPLVPFLLVGAVIVLQAIPVAVGNALYGSVIRGGLAVTFVEQLFWFLLFLLTIILSLYLISSSLIALYVVTLPEMTPKTALVEARKLVLHRRINVLLKIIALVLLMGAIYVAVIFPALLTSALLAQILFFILTILALPFVVAYLFVLYRELL